MPIQVLLAVPGCFQWRCSQPSRLSLCTHWSAGIAACPACDVGSPHLACACLALTHAPPADGAREVPALPLPARCARIHPFFKYNGSS